MLEQVSSLATFRGRIGRAEWWITLFFAGAVLSVYLSLFNLSIFELLRGAYTNSPNGRAYFMGMLYGFQNALVFGPAILLTIAWLLTIATTKRFHDRDKSGWWALLLFVPVVGQIWVLFECGLLPGMPGANAYGVDPADEGDIARRQQEPAREVVNMRLWEATHPKKLAVDLGEAAPKSAKHSPLKRATPGFGQGGRSA